jgi:hypothetical protein
MGFLSFLQLYIVNYDEKGRTSSMQDSDMKNMEDFNWRISREENTPETRVDKYTTSRAESVANLCM